MKRAKKTVTRLNLTDRVLLDRIEVARERMGDSTATKTAVRLLDMTLTELGIGLPNLIAASDGASAKAGSQVQD